MPLRSALLASALIGSLSFGASPATRLPAALPHETADGGPSQAKASLSIGAAANLLYALDALDAAFEKENPGVALTTATGASGSLVAQIRNGAPFDLFLSADLDYPRRLAQSGDAVSASLTPFAFGRLVLWTTKPGLDLPSVAAAVRNPNVRKLAIANPETAPYGRAAREALGKLGLSEDAGPKLVLGENISQTAQFVETGNADAGFVAMSLVTSPKLMNRGRWIEVPATCYTLIAQGAILTRRGAANPAARDYLAFLGSPEARKILERYGYGVPPSPP